jgi:hypothetical protein
MSNQLPKLGMDGVLCDRPQDGCFIGGKRNYARDNINRKATKMAHVMTKQEVESHTKKLVARLLGQDAAVDDETAEKLKSFLHDKLSADDHAVACGLIDGGAPVAEDDDPDLPQNAIGRAADFNRRFPDLGKINIDASGIQPRKRPAAYSADGARSFKEMFPQAAKIRCL